MVAAGDLLEHPLEHGHLLQTTGVIHMEFEGSVLCRIPASRERDTWRDCLPVSLDWARLGGDQKRVWRVLEQWNGKTVRIEGIFYPKEEGYSGPEGRLLCVRNVELLEDRGRPSRSYCLGDRSPRPAGLLIAEVPDNGRRRGIREVQPGVLAFLDATSLAVRILRGAGANLQKTEVRLSLPPPFQSGWDVWEFQPINESTFVFTLVDDVLYGFKNGVVHRLEEAEVDLLRSSQRGGVLFRSRRFDGGKLVSTALKRVNADLEIEARWASEPGDPHWYPPALTGVWSAAGWAAPDSQSRAELSCRDLALAQARR